MLSCYSQLLWLKLRHVKTQLLRIMYVTGSDFAGDSGFLDRTYQVYTLLALILATVFSWLGVLDVVSDTFISLGAPVAEAVFLCMALVPGTVLLFFIISYLRSSPLKLSPGDISYIAASPVPMSALLHVELASQVLLYGASGFFPAYLLATGVYAVLPGAAQPLECAILMALLIILVCFVSWLPGLIRLLLKPPSARIVSVAVVIVAFCAVSLFSNYLAGYPSAATTAGVLLLSSFSEITLVLCGLLALLVLLLSLIGTRLSAANVIAENALYAELYPLRQLQFYNPDSYIVLRRRKKLALRGSRLSLPGTNTPQSLLTRALLSHLRQYEGLLSILLMGFVLVPAGAFLLVSNLNVMFYLTWAVFLLALPAGQRELTLVFRDDQRNRMIRDHLPYDTLGLLLLDSLPALALACLFSLIALTLVVPFGWQLLACILYALSINVAVVLCTGLDHVRFSAHGRRFSYEVSFLLFAGITLVLSLLGSVAGILGALAILAGYVQLIRRGRE